MADGTRAPIETMVLIGDEADIRHTIDALPQYVLLIDSSHNVVMANQAIYSTYGLRPEDVVGRYCPQVIHGLEGPFAGCPVEEAFATGQSVERELYDAPNDRWVTSGAYLTKLVTAENKPIFLHVVSDITDKKRAAEELARLHEGLEESIAVRTRELEQANEELQKEIAERVRAEVTIRRMAYFDGLTGLPNRANFSRLLSTAIETAKRESRRCAVALLDLDGLKTVNDTMGHDAGDMLLSLVATRLRETMRGDDTAARMGGDEFLFIFNDIAAAEDLDLIGERVLAAFAEPFEVQGTELAITASVGGAVYPDDGIDEATLLTLADVAMYDAKRSGKNRFHRVGRAPAEGVSLFSEPSDVVDGWSAMDAPLRRSATTEPVSGERSKRLQAVLDNAPFGAHLYRLEDDDRLVFSGFNQKAEEMLGIEHSKLLGLTLEEAFPGNIGTVTPERYRSVARHGTPWEATEYAYDSDGVAGVFEIYAFSFAPGEMTVFFRDITEEKRAAAEVRAGRERLRATIERAAIGIARVGLDGRFIDVNERMCEMFGYSAAELVPMTFGQITHPDEVSRDVAGLQRLKNGEIENYSTEKRYVTKDGAILWAEMSATLARNADGRPGYIVTTVQDISERRAAEEALESTTRALRALSGVNESLVRATREEELLAHVCQIISQQGYALAWVGYAENDDAKTVRPVESAGDSTDYVRGLNVSWGEGPLGSGPVGRAIRGARSVVARHLDADPGFAPWLEIARRFGFEAIAALPLTNPDGSALGSLSIYSRNPDAFDEAELGLLSEMAEDLSYGIESLRSRIIREQAEGDLRHSNERLQAVLKQITETMGKIVEARDPYTQGHQRRVALVCGQIAQEMGLSEEEREGAEAAALVHDVGKLSVPAEILNKPGKLEDVEFAIIKSHSQTGYEILKDIDFGWPVAEIVLQHHERMDGSGYPNSLMGDDILPAARILAVADVVEAIASHRPYRPALGLEEAIDELRRNPDKFDSEVVSACIRLYEEGRLELET